MLDVANKYLDSPQAKNESLFDVPILKLSYAEIKRLLHLEQLFEHSLFIIVLTIIGHILYFPLGSIAYVGWFFIFFSVLCWLVSTVHGLFAFSSLIPNLAVRIPAWMLFLVPFFFPTYGPTFYLLMMIALPFIIRNAIKKKGIRTEGNSIQEDDKMLLETRKLHLEQRFKRKS